MWPEGQWEVLKKTEPDGAEPHTQPHNHTQTWQLYDWIGPLGPILWEKRKRIIDFPSKILFVPSFFFCKKKKKIIYQPPPNFFWTFLNNFFYL